MANQVKSDAALARHGLTRRMVDRYLERSGKTLATWADERGYTRAAVLAAFAGTPSAQGEQILEQMDAELANELRIIRAEINRIQDEWITFKARLEDLEKYLSHLDHH